MISSTFVVYRHPLGWGAGLQGRWRHRPPSLLHWDIRILGGYREIGRPADGACADTAQTTRAVYRPTLEPPLCHGRAGGFSRGTRPCPGSMAAVILQGDGSKADGACADTAQIMQGGLPPYLRAAIVPGRGRAALPWDPPSPWLYGGGYHLGRMGAMRTALADTAQITQGG